MLIRQGEARSPTIDRRLACILAGVAGALNTAAFHAVGFFSANMTGNVSVLSNHVAFTRWLDAFHVLMVVLSFITGATFATMLINEGQRRCIADIYAIAILIESGLLFLLGCGDLAFDDTYRVPVMVLGLAFLMGLQNATATRITNARVRTTHVSGMATDIGIELSVLLEVLVGRTPKAEGAPYIEKLLLHGESLLSFLAGGVIGVLIYQTAGGGLLIGCAALLFWVSSRSLCRPLLTRWGGGTRSGGGDTASA